MDKLCNSTLKALWPLRAQRRLEEMMRVGFFSGMFIAMSVRPTLTDELLKVNSALKIIFSIIKDQCSRGQRSSK